VEITDITIGSLLDDMADLDAFGQSSTRIEGKPSGFTVTVKLGVEIDDNRYVIGAAELVKAFEGVLSELRKYPAAVLTSNYVRQVANCIANNDPNEIKLDELLEDLLRLALEAAGWKEIT
jgi:hypothetical protein